MNDSNLNSKIIHIAALLLTAVLLVHVMVEARTILLPIAWAVFIALIILPAVRWLESCNVPRALAIIMVLVVVTVVLSTVVYVLSLQAAGLLADTPVVTDKLQDWMTDLQLFLATNFGISPEMLSQQLLNSFSGILDMGLREVRNSLQSVFETLTLLSVIPVYVFLLLYYRDLFFEGILLFFQNYRVKASPLLYKISRVVQQYLNGLMLITLIVWILFFAILGLLGIGYAFFFAVLLAVFNLIPYVGVILSSVIVVLYAFVTTDSLFYPAAVLVSLWLIQLLENNLITPYVIGSRVKVNPMAALIAIFAGAKIWGVSGMIIFIPLLGGIKVIAGEFQSLQALAVLLGSSPSSKKSS